MCCGKKPGWTYDGDTGIHTLSRALFKIWRLRRQKLFSDLLKPFQGDSILDIGGLPGFWKEARLPGVKINCLNPDKKAVEGYQNQVENISMLEGGVCDLPCIA